MALEDLTGTKYINSLNSSNPEVGDNRTEGDDHIRGIKNTIKTTFPNIDGAVNVDEEQLNSIGKNLLINGDMTIWQRHTSFTAAGVFYDNTDGSYTADRWVFIASGADAADISRETSVVPTGGSNAMKLDCETATSQYGIVQVVETQTSKSQHGKYLTLSFKARYANQTNLSTLRCDILGQTTADIDPIATWAGGGTNPTWDANSTSLCTPSNLSLSSSFQTFSITTDATFDGSTYTNIAAVIWVDDTDVTAGELLYITDVQLEIGSNVTDFEILPRDTVVNNCLRYFETSYEFGTAVGTATTDGVSHIRGTGAHTDLYGANIKLVKKRVAPTITIYNPNDGSSGEVYNTTSGNFTVNDVLSETTESLGVVSLDSAIADGNIVYWHWTADAEIG